VNYKCIAQMRLCMDIPARGHRQAYGVGRRIGARAGSHDMEGGATGREGSRRGSEPRPPPGGGLVAA
jgi:hypothetical protein